MIKILMTTRMLVILPSALFFLVLMPPMLFFLSSSFLRFSLWFSCLRCSPPSSCYSGCCFFKSFYPWYYLFWSFCLLYHPLGPSNHVFSSFLFHFFPRFYTSLFFFVRFIGSKSVSHQDLDAHTCYAIPPSLSSMRVYKAISLLLEEDYIV